MVNISISEWYNNESDKIILLSRSNDLNLNEKVRVYHHGQHLQFRKRSSILQLQTPTGIVSGHKDCAEALENNVFIHLTNTADLDHLSQDILLKEVDESFTDLDNENLKADPTEAEIKKDSRLMSGPYCTRYGRADSIPLSAMLGDPGGSTD